MDLVAVDLIDDAQSVGDGGSGGYDVGMLPELRHVVDDLTLVGSELVAELRAGAAALTAQPDRSLVACGAVWPPHGLENMRPGADGPLTTFQLPITPGGARTCAPSQVGRWWLFLADVIEVTAAVRFTLKRPNTNALTFARLDGPFFSRRHLKGPVATGEGFDLRPLYAEGVRGLRYARLKSAPSTVFAVAGLDDGGEPMKLLPVRHACELINQTRRGVVHLQPNGLVFTEDPWSRGDALVLDAKWSAPWHWTVPASPQP